MKNIREILPGIYQCLSFTGQEVQATIYVKRSFGNYLFYEATLHNDFLRLIRAQGGLVKYFHEADQHGDEIAKQFFARFGASSVFLSAPDEMKEYRWEIFAEQRKLYQGVSLINLETLPGLGIYVMKHKGFRILLPAGLLALHNGHWAFRLHLNQQQRYEITEKLRELEFDYLLPQFFKGYISFQPVEDDFKEIQLHHLAHAAV
ncbi:MAG: hypothetical protein ACOH5I_09845 [Oligoflexus sp.]